MAAPDVTVHEVVHHRVSPAFVAAPPAIVGAERIPATALAKMEPVWNQVWFGPRPVTLSVLEDVFVGAEGLVLTTGLEVVDATTFQHAADMIEAVRQDVAQRVRMGGVPRLRGEWLICVKSGAGAYGHWLAEMLPRAWLASQLWPRPLRFLVHAASGPLRATMRDSLGLLGIGPALCVAVGREPVRVDRLILVDGMAAHGTYMSPLVTGCLRDLAARIAPAGDERLFVTRSAASTRRFAGEDRLIGLARDRGFRVLDPSEQPFAQQVAAFRAARVVVGAMGSGLANLAFCGAGAEARVVAPATMPDTFFWFIARHCGLRHTEVRCGSEAGVERPVPWDGRLETGPLEEAVMFALPEEAGLPADPARHCDLARLFDATHYAARNPDVVAAGVDLFWHYRTVGWTEGRTPSAWFDGAAYLARYSDVAAAGVNPLIHYWLHGAAEGRAIDGAAG